MWDLPAVLYLYLILLFSSFRLISTNWSTHLYAVLFLTVIGTTIGLALGASRFRARTASLLALAYSIILIPGVIGFYFYKQVPWFDRLTNIFGRLNVSLSLFFQRRPVADTLLFIAFVMVVYWGISLLAGYQWSRNKNITLVLLPAWVAMVTVQVYDNILNNHIFYLIICMFLSLLLLGRKFIVEKQRFWQTNRIHVSGEAVHDLNMVLVIISSAILLLTWVIPVNSHQLSDIKTAWEKISEPWQSLRKDMGNAISGLKKNTIGSSNDLFGRDYMQLGQDAIDGDAAVFNVKIQTDKKSIRYYWRVRMYDQYNDDQWGNSKNKQLVFEPYMPGLRLPGYSGTLTDRFTFTMYQGNLINLPVPRQAIWISRPVNTYVFQLENGLVDPILMQADIAIQAGEAYQVQAVQSQPSILDLQRAGQKYPDWVIEHYLQRPDNLSERVKELAVQITSGENNPYDKAEAITEYLRKNITYKKQVPSAPYGTNVLEWFLLDYKQGYCNYYATAEVILLRLAGIPARFVVGFAQGENLVGQEDTYLIRQKDAHAWAEAYFPGIGWVEFEPTTSQPDLIRPAGDFSSTQTGSPPVPESTTNGLDGSTPPPGNINSQQFGERLTAPGWLMLLLGLIIVSLVGISTLKKWKRRESIPSPLSIRLKNSLESNSIHVPEWLARMADQAGEAPMQRYFNVVYHSLNRLGHPGDPADTPQDISNALTGNLPEATREITLLLNEYQRFLFSQHAADEAAASLASSIIRKQTDRAVRKIFINKLRNLLRLKN